MILRPRSLDENGVVHYAYFGNNDVSSSDCYDKERYLTPTETTATITCLVCLSIH